MTKYVPEKASLKKSNGVSGSFVLPSLHVLSAHTVQVASKKKKTFPGSHLEVSPALSKCLKNTPREHCTHVPENLLGGNALVVLST